MSDWKKKRNSNIFAQQIDYMENIKQKTGLYWVLFILSVIAFYGLYQWIGGVSILMLPFNVTFLAKALDIM